MSSDLASTESRTRMPESFVRAVGRVAYVWGWPMVSMINRRTALTSVPEPGLRGGVLPNAPLGRVCMMTDYIPAGQRFVACTNQDVLYGFGFGSLDEQPAVFQIPDFGDRFWVAAAWDHRTDSFAQMGKQYGTKPGFYAVVGPNWEGELPEQITGSFRSTTALAAFCPRVFIEDTPEDRAKVMELLPYVTIYPLDQFDGTMKSDDWANVPTFPVPEAAGEGEIRWVDPAKFFDQLPEVLDSVPPLPGEEALYQQFRVLLSAAAASPDVKQALIEVAHEAEQEIITPLLRWEYNGPSAGNNWFSPTNNSAFGTDYLTRTALARSNMFENAPQETKYIFTDTDADGIQLDGTHTYTVRFGAGALPPVNGFFSVTLYNKHHFYAENDLGRYSLGTKNPDLAYGADGSLTLYVGNSLPDGAPATNWLPAPADAFSLYIRAYWPQQAILDGTWTPPRVERSN
ncbi:DUF1214 domain-containing protein [Streptomyces sp. NBC_00876]|uniref:DUF1254 domain-containing protein n=1 Tax=Streptomyces sp. NBC_00876 TaxID=2975853 RepID=UPI00386CA0D6|nr:DUF1214 domain-containing protein [Streptomyces sp. NBC_00876]